MTASGIKPVIIPRPAKSNADSSRDTTLTVRQKLVIYSSGKVNGKIRYGKLVVEEGGQLAGEIEAGFSSASSSSSNASSSSHLQRGAGPLRTEPATALAA